MTVVHFRPAKGWPSTFKRVLAAEVEEGKNVIVVRPKVARV